VIEAALAGKDIYVQKPLALTIAESEAARRVVRAKGRILQMGSQQRSAENFRQACELVRNGRIGKVHTIKIGLPNDPAGKIIAPQPVPANLDYDRWLGPVASDLHYIEERVHPQKDYGRPGWLRVEDFSAGMITGWGSHHIDIAHWAMGWDKPGPIQIKATASFPSSGIWTVHTAYHIEATYPDQVTMLISDKFHNGILFEGSDGWIFVSRGGSRATASDPVSVAGKGLAASSEKILTSRIAPEEVHLQVSNNHLGDFLTGVQTRKDPVAHIDAGSYTFNAISAMWAAMKLGRTLRYDPAKAEFIGDDQANGMRSRPQRPAYSVDAVLKKAGM
jgi:predicted dehydrogenase